MTTQTEHIIDATGKSLGRVATEIAVVLMGKDEPNFQRHLLAGKTVSVVNAHKLAITEKKKDQKEYITFSGYPSGQKRANLRRVIEKKGHEEAIRKAVYGMLPSNRLRSPLMKKLTVTE